MNEKTSKKILFNKSTLFSLKAELLKKQEEVYEKKQLPHHKLDNFKPPKPKQIHDDTSKDKKRTLRDNLKAIDTEELEACRKSKLALEKKAELYNHLSDSAGSSQLAGRFLVNFDTKKQESEKSTNTQNEKEEEPQQDYEHDEDDWVEFVDCLGRTRKCLKSDLESYVKWDKELMKVMNKDKVHTGLQDSNDNEEPRKEKPFLVQKTHDYLNSLREKWEQKENELLAKEKDIHYQDLLFDEARIHGVGYYSFSTDETEREKQMEELKKRREETLRAQKEAEEERKKRDELIAARAAAARARRRARAGLPPEEPKENEKDFTTCLLEFLTQQKNEADAKAKENEKKLKEEKEKERQMLRDTYIREWDLGKEGLENKGKRFREMSQEEYVEQQRLKRIDEFAPLHAQESVEVDYVFDEFGRKISPEEIPLASKTWADVRPKERTPAPDINISDPDEQKGLYFSTAKKSDMKYKNFVKSHEEASSFSSTNNFNGLGSKDFHYPQQHQDPIPIVDELNDPLPVHGTVDNKTYETRNAEIAPPPTYEYYGPTPKHPRYQKPFESDINESFAQGTKSLETKSNTRQLPSHYDFTFD